MGGSISGQNANQIAYISYPVLAVERLQEYIPVPEDTVRERIRWAMQHAQFVAQAGGVVSALPWCVVEQAWQLDHGLKENSQPLLVRRWMPFAQALIHACLCTLGLAVLSCKTWKKRLLGVGCPPIAVIRQYLFPRFTIVSVKRGLVDNSSRGLFGLLGRHFGGDQLARLSSSMGLWTSCSFWVPAPTLRTCAP